MFNFRSSPGFQGAGYIILNILRVINIITLLLVAAACMLMIIFAELPNAYQLFADIALFFIVCVCGLLIWTELPFNFGKAWIRQTWPVVSAGRGFTWLGIAMILMGCHTLGGLSHEPYTAEKVGKSVWQVIIAAGILAITFGFFNIIASFLFQNKSEGASAREVRQDGAIAHQWKANDNDFVSERSNSVRQEKTRSFFPFMGKSSSRPKISHPIDVEHRGGQSPVPEDRNSPILPGAMRPPTALHPVYNPGRRSSYYSEASHIDRFGEKMI